MIQTTGLLFTLAKGEALSETVAQEVLDSDRCCFDWSPLEVHEDWDGDENGVHLTQTFQCVAFSHVFHYEYVDRESGWPKLEDALDMYPDDVRPFPIQCEHKGDRRHPQQFVPWGVARRAFKVYDRFHPGTTVERLAERGGFGETELVTLLMAPKTSAEWDRLIREKQAAAPLSGVGDA